ncbi:AAA family ATPase [Romboutsia sp.]|uniref:AAA family ATPase n=1 Tax=Romboutsia sp. TaxID=1965302 RepID=UPI003F405EC3
MLLRFNVKNFLSFENITEFSMFPGKVRSKENHLMKTPNTNILKFTTIYGANAAGKSNLVKAIDHSREIILFGLDHISRDYYNKGNTNNKFEKTTFEYEIMIGNKYYAYGFNVIINKKEIVGEWLYDITGKEEKVIFERDIENKTFDIGINFKDSSNNMRFNVYFDDNRLNKKTLLLNELNRNKEHIYENNSEFVIFKNIFDWFMNCLDINFASAPITNFQYMLGEDIDFNESIVKTLNMFGTGITNFSLIESDLEDIKNDLPKEILENIKNELITKRHEHNAVNLRGINQFYNITLDKNENLKVKTLSFKHENQDCDFYLSEESDGTRRLLDLIEILLNSKDKVFIIDEIDRSLHPNLTHKFIELFLQLSESKNVQLIVTTHEDRILDLELLRRDEIWFAQKSKTGSTELYSLENYSPRFDTKIVKAYLEGRYGAIPSFKNLNLDELNRLYAQSN